MLNFVSFHLAIKYFLLSFIAVVGVLQLMATSQKLVGLSLGGRVSALGIPLGVSLVFGAFVWFFSTTPEVFSPGLAGAELSLLFGAGGLCAFMFTLGMSSFVLEMRGRGERRGRREKEKGEGVAFQQLRGALYIPGDRPFPLPAICAVPSPSEGEAPLLPLIRRIVGGGFIVLVVDWSEPRYPDVLALLPTAIAYLLRREEVDPKRIGALGVDLGGIWSSELRAQTGGLNRCSPWRLTFARLIPNPALASSRRCPTGRLCSGHAQRIEKSWLWS